MRYSRIYRHCMRVFKRQAQLFSSLFVNRGERVFIRAKTRRTTLVRQILGVATPRKITHELWPTEISNCGGSSLQGSSGDEGGSCCSVRGALSVAERPGATGCTATADCADIFELDSSINKESFYLVRVYLMLIMNFR